MRHTVAVASIVLMALLVLVVGCGGGGGALPRTNTATLTTSAHILPATGANAVVSQTESTVTLAGGPAPAVGDVLVSSEGDGMMRTVTAVAAADGTTVLTTAPATLSQVFQQADIAVTHDLAPAELTSVRSLQSGVRVGPADTRQQGDTLVITLTDVDLNGVTVSGTVRVRLTLDFAYRQDGPFTPTYARLYPRATVSGNLHLVGKDAGTIVDFRKAIAHLDGRFTVPVPTPAGPVPLVLVWKGEMALKFGAFWEVGFDTTVSGSVTGGVGAEWRQGLGTQRLSSLSADFKADGTKIFGTVRAAFSPWEINSSITVMGAVGPQLTLALPQFTTTFTREQPLDAAGKTTLEVLATYRAQGQITFGIFSNLLNDIDVGGPLENQRRIYFKEWLDTGASDVTVQ